MKHRLVICLSLIAALPAYGEPYEKCAERLEYFETSTFPTSAITLVDMSGCDQLEQNPEYVVPLRVLDNEALIDIEIQGRTVAVTFDTGGFQAIALPPEFLKILQLDHSNEVSTYYDAKGNKLSAGTFIIPNLKIGELEFHDVRGTEAIYDPAYLPPTVGHIGLPLLREYVVRLDYENRVLQLIKPNSSLRLQRCKGIASKFIDGNAEPITVISTEIGQLKMYWDTGATATLVRSGTLAERGAAVVNGWFITRRFEIESTDFGPVTIASMDFSEPSEVDGFVGHNFFADKVVCFDFPGRTIIIVDS